MKSIFWLVSAILVVACAEKPAMKAVPEHPSVTELAAMLGAGETTSTLIVTELLRRAGESESLNAFITIDSAGALARAAELDELRGQGNILGPLHGVPLVVKDNIHVAGLPNTAGTPGLESFIPAADSPTIAALRGAGAIILGKTNLHELAFGITSDNGAYGAVANPFDTTMFAGGSSGGTASAVSAGLAPAGLGTDTGGSARIPAALTGVVGFRPSTDRYDSSAVTPISHTRDTVGIIARNVADVSLMDAVIAAGDASHTVKSPSEIRLGIARTYYFDNVDAASALVIDAALNKLRDAGVTLVEVEPGDVGALNMQTAFPIALYEVVHDLPAYLEEYQTGKDFEAIAAAVASPDVKGLFQMLGTPEGQVPEAVYANALSVREDMRTMFREYFDSNNLDGMIFPTTLLPARPIEGSMESVELNGQQVPTFPTYIHNAEPASIAALPGISLPVGLTATGLPVGIEIDGPEGSDRQLLAVAAALEVLFEYSARP
jgi:mandelamide amidase